MVTLIKFILVISVWILVFEPIAISPAHAQIIDDSWIEDDEDEEWIEEEWVEEEDEQDGFSQIRREPRKKNQNQNNPEGTKTNSEDSGAPRSQVRFQLVKPLRPVPPIPMKSSEEILDSATQEALSDTEKSTSSKRKKKVLSREMTPPAVKMIETREIQEVPEQPSAQSEEGVKSP